MPEINRPGRESAGQVLVDTYKNTTTQLARMFLAFGDSMATLFDDPPSKRKSEALGLNAAEAIKATGEKLSINGQESREYQE